MGRRRRGGVTAWAIPEPETKARGGVEEGVDEKNNEVGESDDEHVTEAVAALLKRPGRHAMFSAKKAGSIVVVSSETAPRRVVVPTLPPPFSPRFFIICPFLLMKTNPSLI